jgi:hypothetical protein
VEVAVESGVPTRGEVYSTAGSDARQRNLRAHSLPPGNYHKPLLLLVLAELAEQGKLASKIIPLTGELVSTVEETRISHD